MAANDIAEMRRRIVDQAIEQVQQEGQVITPLLESAPADSESTQLLRAILRANWRQACLLTILAGELIEQRTH